jgi:cbb3-type cytochrome oxidase maturation protein
MSIIYVMIPLGLALVTLAVAFFFWAVASGEFDDLETQGTLVLFDEEAREPTRADAKASSRSVR